VLALAEARGSVEPLSPCRTRPAGFVMAFIVCGVDPGLSATGYAVIDADPEQASLIDAGVCRTDSELSLANRLAQLDADVTSLFDEHRPTVVAVERLYAHYKHPRTAIMMGHARGIILCAAGRMGIEVADPSATHVKRLLTGNGHASKNAIQRAIRITLGLGEMPQPPDVADAMAIALCCAADRVRQAMPR
jgi:crossover junction endodeoxyribonuclease RuvC